MSGSSSSVALLALTSLIGVGLAVGYVYFQGSSPSPADGSGGCPFGKLSSEEKKKGGKCPATGTVVAPEKRQEHQAASPKAAQPLQHEPVVATLTPEKPASPPASPVQAAVAPASPPASPVKTISKSPPASPSKPPASPVKAASSPVVNAKCASPPASPAKLSPPVEKASSPKKESKKELAVEEALVEEAAVEVAASFVSQVVMESVENVEDEVAEKDEYVQVELTQSTENIREKAGWTMPIEELEQPVVVDEPVALLTPPAPAPVEEVEEPKVASPDSTPVASPSKPRSRKNSSSSAKKLPKTPPPSPVKAEVVDAVEITEVKAKKAEVIAQSTADASDMLPSPKKESVALSDDGDEVDQEAEENDGESAPSSNDTAPHTPKKSKSKKKKGKKRR
ncbi:hypothetical protein PINS_up001193 [Pythium insidiosum]|nr:hypothetical protein PINS_up001193 [Pythium insidiosum]